MLFFYIKHIAILALYWRYSYFGVGNIKKKHVVYLPPSHPPTATAVA